MSKQHRNNKLLTATITPAATEAIEILKEHYDETKTSRVVDTVVKEHMMTLGYQLREKTTMESVIVQIVSAGKSITQHASGGQNYFEAPESGNYIIRIRNNGYERKEVVVSVDGLSVMDGDEAAFETRGYILSAYSSIDIKGWRRTSDDVAAFKFAKIEDSYSTKAGKGTSNVGVIGVAVFNEKVEQVYWTQPLYRWLMGQPIGNGGEMYGSLGGTAGAPAGGFATTNSVSPSTTRSKLATKSRRISKGSDVPNSYNIGTGYGKETQMKVTETSFTRESTSPNFVSSYRYASRPTLIKWGVITEQAQTPDPFPGNKVACKAPPGWEG
jgi:hypothetical protein